MFTTFACLILFFSNMSFALSGTTEYIRTYDLGGSGLKTALLRYDKETQKMDWVEHQTQLGKCPDDMEVHEWIRTRMQMVIGKDLDREINSGYLFGFSLSELDKLRAKALSTTNISSLFKLPSTKVRCIDDGAAHLIASLHTPSLELPKGPIWNFSIGTAVGFGFTDSHNRVRNLSDFQLFFGCLPCRTKEPRSGLEVWIPCGSHFGFDQIVAEHQGIVDDRSFIEFASRWKGYIESNILEYSTIISPDKRWGTPAALVFTGGHIDMYANRFCDTLRTLNLTIPVFTGPKHAGLLGAAWNTVTNHLGQTPLIQAIAHQDLAKTQSLLDSGTDVNQRDALGNTPLVTAIKTGKIAFVKMLVAAGAKINELDYASQTPLFLAVRLNKLDIVAFLLAHGADSNNRDCWNQTALLFSNQNKEMENLLLVHGVKR